MAGWRSELAGCRSTLSMSKIKVRISESKYRSFYKTLTSTLCWEADANCAKLRNLFLIFKTPQIWIWSLWLKCCTEPAHQLVYILVLNLVNVFMSENHVWVSGSGKYHCSQSDMNLVRLVPSPRQYYFNRFLCRLSDM